MKQTSDSTIWDVLVIGGGPSGMMAASTAAQSGATVALLEKNKELGKKLSITGGGRCNITNNKPVVRDMLASYKDDGKYLFSTFSQHGVAESITWFNERNLALKEENEGRLFPITESAETVRDVLVDELQKRNVKVFSNESVSDISYDKQTCVFSITTNKSLYQAKKCIIATGGYARPDTGSTGDGFLWLKQLGHTIEPNSTALVPVALKTSWSEKLSGLTLPEVKVSVWVDNTKVTASTGRLLFTHFGVTGPLILNMSKLIGDSLPEGTVTLRIDLFPKLDAGEMKKHIHTLLQSNKKLQNALAEILPLQLIKGILSELHIDGETPCHSVRKEDRVTLFQHLKAVPLEVKGLLGTNKAVVSSGGVSLNEIDFKTMESKIVPNLFIVGDMLNINRPSGGYSLQLCWSTGFVAGLHASQP